MTLPRFSARTPSCASASPGAPRSGLSHFPAPATPSSCTVARAPRYCGSWRSPKNASQPYGGSLGKPEKGNALVRGCSAGAATCCGVVFRGDPGGGFPAELDVEPEAARRAWQDLACSSVADRPAAARWLSAACRRWCRVHPTPCGSTLAEAVRNRCSARIRQAAPARGRVGGRRGTARCWGAPTGEEHRPGRPALREPRQQPGIAGLLVHVLDRAALGNDAGAAELVVKGFGVQRQLFLLGSGCGSERYAAIPTSSHAAIDGRIRRLSLRFQSHSYGQHVPGARSSSEVACAPPHLVPLPDPRGTD
jgi:hypothetical protein